MSVLGQKHVQQFLQLHHLRNVQNVAPDSQQIRLRIAHHRDQFLNVNEADRVIEMTAAKRETRVPRFQRLLHIFLETLLQIERDDLAPRRHDIAHHAAPHVESVDENIAAERGDFIRFFALIENEAQFLFAMRQLGARDRLDAKKPPQQKIRGAVKQPDHWPKQNVKRAQRSHQA